MSAKNPRIGSNFEDFLREEGRLEESTALAMKRVISWQFQQAMDAANVTRADMARRMNTSRAVVVRLLNEKDTSVTLSTINKAANALGVVATISLKLKAFKKPAPSGPAPIAMAPISLLAAKRAAARR